MNKRFSVLLLAAGKATRFKSEQPKLLHRLAGRLLGEYVLRAAMGGGPERTYMVVGFKAKEVREAFARPSITFIEQKAQLGTGHALMVARRELDRCPSPTLVVLVGDAPLLRPETIRELVETHVATRSAATVLSTVVDNPTGYGRIVRAPTRAGAGAKRAGKDVAPTGGGGAVRAIVEEKVATPAQKKIQEINSGILCFSRAKLLERLGELSSDNAQKEYLLTDLIEIFNRHGEKVTAFSVSNRDEVLGVNDRWELARVERVLRLRKAEALMRDGVTIVDPETTYIDENVAVGPDTVIYPGVSLLGSTHAGKRCVIGPHATVVDSVLGDDATVRHGSLVSGSELAAGSSVGPFAHLREGAVISAGARIGNFVEVKKSRVGPNSKALHLTYLGDATLERDVNIGAGTVTCNYDGEKKYPTTIEEGSFIGSGTMLVAPVRVGKRSYVAAGSTITADVPPESLALGRARQVNKEGWARERAKADKTAKDSPGPPPSAPSSSPAKPDLANDPPPLPGLSYEQTRLVVEALSRAAEKRVAQGAIDPTDPGNGPIVAQAPAPAGAVRVREAGTVTVFDVEGRLTRGESASELRDKIHRALDSGRHSILLNMENVTFIDSAGIGELMAAANELSRLGGNLKLSALPPRVARSLKASNLDRVLDIHPSEAEALASFSKTTS